MKNLPFIGKKNLFTFLLEPLKDKTVMVFAVASLILNVVNWLVIYITTRPSVEPIFLHYNIYFGIDLIGQWYKIYYIPLSGLAILLVNYLICSLLFRSRRVLGLIAIGFSLPLQLFLGLAAVLIILINS